MKQLLMRLQAPSFAAENGEQITSGLMQASMEILKLELGMNGHVFTHPYHLEGMLGL
jgi:hypothetical protein